MSRLDERLAKGDLRVGGLWAPEGIDAADAIQTFMTNEGKQIQMAFCEYGLAVDSPSDQVWQLPDASIESLRHFLTMDDLQQILEASGFRIVPA